MRGTKPETFIVVGVDFEAAAITSTSEALPETGMGGYLQKAAASAKDIKDWIDQARKYPG